MQFPNNVIPQSRISPVSAKVAALLPSNITGVANNFIYNPNQNLQVHRIDSRGDQSFSDRDKLFMRFRYLTQAFLNPGPLPPPLIGATTNNQNNHSTQALSSALGQTHIFSSSLVNEFDTGYSRIYDNRGDLLSGSPLGPQ